MKAKLIARGLSGSLKKLTKLQNKLRCTQILSSPCFILTRFFYAPAIQTPLTLICYFSSPQVLDTPNKSTRGINPHFRRSLAIIFTVIASTGECEAPVGRKTNFV